MLDLDIMVRLNINAKESELSILGRCALCTSIPSEGSSHVSDSGCHERLIFTSREVDVRLPDLEVKVIVPGG